MTHEELIALVESVLGMDEQADRSVALDTIREELHAIHAVRMELDNTISSLRETEGRLTERNNELFMRVEGSPAETVVTETTIIDDPELLISNVEELFE